MGLLGFLLHMGESPEDREKRYREEEEAWERQRREEELEEEYDIIDGIEDADY